MPLLSHHVYSSCRFFQLHHILLLFIPHKQLILPFLPFFCKALQHFHLRTAIQQFHIFLRYFTIFLLVRLFLHDAVSSNHAVLLFREELVCVYFIDMSTLHQCLLQSIYGLSYIHNRQLLSYPLIILPKPELNPCFFFDAFNKFLP